MSRRKTRFEKALENNPAPMRLGDTRIEFEPTLLVGKALAAPAIRRSGLMLALGVIGAVTAVALILFSSDWSLWTAGILLLATGVAMGMAIAHEQRARRRMFVLYFLEHQLRLDLPTRVFGAPRTLRIDFADIEAVSCQTHVRGHLQLLIDFHDGKTRRRELLVDLVNPDQDEQLERFRTMFEHAIGAQASTHTQTMWDSSFFE